MDTTNEQRAIVRILHKQRHGIALTPAEERTLAYSPFGNGSGHHFGSTEIDAGFLTYPEADGDE
jgi:hypothetical protein